ncbi:hypothetical protein [Nannocystis punicea]|uniref:Uncharacterized protein n=1 Tax=Nannocystis punicea TaxID=2995304 RepID=A0ABY7GTR4_9BACT|nr:hypothetical protein [Nannocystis poenicansa]WAS90304.1 hypothetical protein O0S08_29295 [Nannocystis poenicansa]
MSRSLAAALAGILSLETATARASAVDLSLETASAASTSVLDSPHSSLAPLGRSSEVAAAVRERPPPSVADLRLPTSSVSAPPRALAFAAVPPAPTLASHLSFETPAPSARDLAYEQGQAAKEAGDDARAAEEFARAYRLTPAGESGPRLMLLRESVDARLRAHERGAGPRDQLCPARALLREHLAGAGAVPLADERARLARVEQGLGAVDCDAADRPVPQDTPQDPPPPAPRDPPRTRPVPQDISTAAAAPVPSASLSGPQQSAQKDMSTATGRASSPGRGLRIAGAATLGLGAAALVPMSVGIAIARDAMRDGRRVCWEMDIACDGGTDRKLLAILERGQQADVLVKIAAPIAGVALLTGLVLLSVGLAARPRRPLAVVPRFGPGSLGVGLQGRF